MVFGRIPLKSIYTAIFVLLDYLKMQILQQKEFFFPVPSLVAFNVNAFYLTNTWAKKVHQVNLSYSSTIDDNSGTIFTVVDPVSKGKYIHSLILRTARRFESQGTGGDMEKNRMERK